MKTIPIWACLSMCHTVFSHCFHNSISSSYLFSYQLFFVDQMHISTKIKHLGYVKNYINSHNKNDQYTLNYNDYLDSTNVGPELFANIELRNTYQSENNFVSITLEILAD